MCFFKKSILNLYYKPCPLNIKNLSFLFAFSAIFVFQSCKKAVPPPTLTLSRASIELGDIKTNAKANLKLIKTGIGTISYTISSSKSWLVPSKESGTLIVSDDSLVIGTNIISNDLLEGDNTALLTIKPIINGVASTEMIVRVNGNFKNTLLTSSTLNIDFGIIKAPKRLSFSLNKVGLENLSFDAISDKPFIKIDKAQGTVTDKLDMFVDVDPNSLEAGVFEGKVTITPKINNVAGKPFDILVKGSFDDIISGNIDAHTLTKNERWGGNINLTGNVIVPIGKTLTILPGAKILVARSMTDMGLNIVVNGALKMNGEPNNIIEIKGFDNTKNDLWEGVFVNADAEISYAYFKNALHPINFEKYNSANKPLKSPDVHNVFFDNCAFGVAAYQSDFEATFFNLSFRNIEYVCFLQVTPKPTTLLDCEFITLKAYIDVAVRVNAAKLTLRNCNFAKKIKPQSHVEILPDISNVNVSSSNMYQMDINVGFGTRSNILNNTSPSMSELKNIGCGFTSKF